ncbi:60s ribosome biogenesis protein mak11 [Linderina macrospora]|uniref:60s ribosome biogenesis protein mak11 n=1 Tax=Linderina macrospora TaxID=4868 RepID=A0ACC1JDJ7_9FUNG|nr:60s ribosome biogenesis protein mak11 [Linderina macrospora]
MAPNDEHRRKRVKVDQKKNKKTKNDAKEPQTAGIDIPALSEASPAKGTFLITAGTYERILYGIEAQFVGTLLTLSPRFIFPAHIGCIKAVSAGGRFLASGSTDEIVKLYDLKKRVELGSLHEHKGSITSLQFHGHTHLLTASDDGAICIFRSKDWEPLKVLKAHRAAVTDIAIHPSGKLALSVSLDRSMILWNLLTGQKASRTRTPQAGELVEWSKSGAMYAIAYATEIQIYRVGEPDAVAMVSSRQRITSILFTEFGGNDFLLVGSQDKHVHIYSTAGDELAAAQLHDNRIKGLSAVDVTFPDESVHTVVASVSSDGYIKAWKLDDLVGELDPKSKPDPKKVPELAVEPLAKYNADVRLTCVAASNDIY